MDEFEFGEDHVVDESVQLALAVLGSDAKAEAIALASIQIVSARTATTIH